ncbi:hypothetical protein JL101_021475 [Skermanella rosea]|uniref:hypothetical protein n=1 Tax=Skermanella rosea TaxID=1817965 RepID=UPI001933A71C|nr:hypothetical protein [Skermanella rosea]UEM02537.1 hypothetical protein JL101_021475 [Skermanella rosea]
MTMPDQHPFDHLPHLSDHPPPDSPVHRGRYRLMLPNGEESPAEVARHLRELVAFLSIPFEGDERPRIEGNKLQGFHILLCTIQGCLADLEGQIRDLIAANAAEYARGRADGLREGRGGALAGGGPA